MTEKIDLMADLEYLTGVNSLDLLDELGNMSPEEVIYSLRELKALVMSRIMTREFPSKGVFYGD